MKTLGYVFSFILMFFYNLLAWALVTWKFWGWFILPIFPSIPAVSYLQAMGIAMFIALFKTNTPSLKKECVDSVNTIVIFFISPILSLFVGWVISSIIF